MDSFPYCRVVVVGATGSGKSTLAQRLARRLDLTYIELDALHWEPNWTEAPNDIFRQRVDQATRTPRWCVAGNYHVVRDIVWPRSQALVWLDYPFLTVFGRLWRRTWKRALTQEKLFGGNTENLWTHFFTKDSLFLWLFKTYWRRKQEYPQLLAQPENAHLKVFRFQQPGAAEAWLSSL